MKPGDPLPSERELMDRFEVGRPAIREAMQALEKAGLISISHGERARITIPTISGMLSQIDLPARRVLSNVPQVLEDLKEVRMFFELGMVRIAAAKATAEDVERLQRHLDHQAAAYGISDEDFIAADVAFHTEIAALSGNRIFAATSTAILGWVSEFHAAILHWKGNEQFTLEEHGKIIERIAANDPDGAALFMEDHLNRTRSAYSSENTRRELGRPGLRDLEVGPT